MNERSAESIKDEYPSYPSDPQTIPDPTYWPLSLAFGIGFFLWGFITSLFLTVTGALFMIISITGWITELNNEK